MRVRPGHHAPLGTTTSCRFQYDPEHWAPELGDIACKTQGETGGWHEADLIRRAYLVVGIAEGREPGRVRLTLERVAYDRSPEPGRVRWLFYDLPRTHSKR